MPKLRLSLFLIIFVVLLPVARAQSCLPFYGYDSVHPYGLRLPFGPSKSFAAKNTAPAYIAALNATGAQLLWDPVTGVTPIGSTDFVKLLVNVYTACVPGYIPPAPPKAMARGSQTGPAYVPWQYSPIVPGASGIALAVNYNRGANVDATIVPAGGNQVLGYSGQSDGTFTNAVMTKFGNTNTKLGPIAVGDFNNDRRADVAVVDTANNVVYVGFGKGDGTYVNIQSYPVGKGPTSVAVTDINGDGVADIVVIGGLDSTVTVLRGAGDGTFFPSAQSSIPGKNPVSMVAYDVNGDGKIDLVIANQGSSDITVLIGNGTGLFGSPVVTKTPVPPGYLLAADFNNDQNEDVLTVVPSLNAVMVLTGSYGNTFKTNGLFLMPNLTTSFSLNDFDGDGNLDLLVPDTDSGSPVLITGRGDGTFNAPGVYVNPNGASSLAAADFNGDGKLDLVVTGSPGNSSTVSVLTGMGNGQFSAPVAVAVPGVPNVVVVGDFNKDGRADIAVGGTQLNILTSSGSGFQVGPTLAPLVPMLTADLNRDTNLDLAGSLNGGFAVMYGNGDGTFKTAVQVNGGPNPIAAVTTDFNGDGIPDLAVANGGPAGGVSIALGASNGLFALPISLSGVPNPRALATGDLNNDGKADLAVVFGTATDGFQVAVFLGKGDGSFQTPFLVRLGPDTPTAVAILDLDGDHNADVVVAECCADSWTSYLRGNGDGTLQPFIPFIAGNGARAIVVGDWNGDFKPDMAVAYHAGDGSAFGGVIPLVNRATNANIGQTFVNTSDANFSYGCPGLSTAQCVSPSQLIAVFGANLTTDTAAPDTGANPLPTKLAGTSVSVRDVMGVTRPALLYYVSPSQINYVVPQDTALGNATVFISSPIGVTTAQVLVTPVTPGLFTATPQGLASGNGVIVSGIAQAFFNLLYTDSTGQIQPLPIYMGGGNDQVFLQLYATGLRNRSSLNGVAITMGGRQVTNITYAGPQSQFPGVDQLNFQIPPSLRSAGKVTIQVSVDGVPANPVNVTVY